jgi:hypothetical protein
MFDQSIKEAMSEKISSKEVQDKIIATSLERFGAERNSKTIGVKLKCGTNLLKNKMIFKN